MKKLFASLCMLVVAASMLGTSTFAWFSMNRTVTANGMNVVAQADASLIISDAMPTATTKTTNVDFNTESTSLLATTHDGTPAGTYLATYGLKTVADAGIIDAYTGLKAEDVADELTYRDVDTSGVYFVDEIVYIAASGKPLEGYDITISVANDISDLPSATSVDFYVLEAKTADVVSADFGLSNFVGTLNLAGVNPTTNKGLNAGAPVDSLTSIKIENTDIPTTVKPADWAGGTFQASAIPVLMRIYIDGALLKQTDVFTPCASQDKYVAGTVYYSKSGTEQAPVYSKVDTTSFEVGVNDVSSYYKRTQEARTFVNNSDATQIANAEVKVTFETSKHPQS